MPISSEPPRESPSTYVVEDRSNQDELKRVQTQDHLLTAGMGGVLPEQPDPSAFQRVLDVGCGTGNWLIELAKAVPTCKVLVGVDASQKFVEYARARAEAERVSDRVEFYVADALRMLEFPNKHFDLVNHRAAISWLRTWDWPKLLQEYQRVCRPGGVVRITESEVIPVNTSPALTRLLELFLKAFYQAGHLFMPTSQSMTNQLAPLLRQHGLQQVQTRVSPIEYHAGTLEGHYYLEDIKLGFRTLLPFLQKWTRVPDDYQQIYQHMLSEVQQPDFVATWHMLTAWGHPRQAKDQPGSGVLG